MNLGNGLAIKISQVNPDLLPDIATGIINAAERHGIELPQFVGTHAVGGSLEVEQKPEPKEVTHTSFGSGVELSVGEIDPDLLPGLARRVVKAARKHGVELPQLADARNEASVDTSSSNSRYKLPVIRGFRGDPTVERPSAGTIRRLIAGP